MVRIIKPDVVGHVSTTTGSDRKTVTRRRHAIYSVDVQPGAHRCSFLCSMLGTITHYCYSLIHVWNRLATAGGDCSVRLWSLPTLLSTLADIIEKDSHLCSLTNHTKSVNIVRWSHCGKYLASGSDDTCVLIYHHTPGGVSTGSFGMQTKDALPNIEMWSRCCSLHGKLP